MTRHDDPRRRLSGLLPLIVLAGALWGAAPAGAASAPACPTGRPLTVTTLCLVNAARAEHGAHRLRFDRRLERVARRHSRDMVAHRYFSHETPSGLSSSDRIAGSGWMRGRRRWTVGENIAWRSRSASPHSIVEAWLRSPAHRRILLQRAFRVAGIGIAPGTPLGARGGATYTADFGT